jgi:two-component system nitrate/nitrite response regulator NarL
MSGVRVLIVDRRRLYREAVRVFLDGTSFSVADELADVSEALAWLGGQQADIVLVGEAEWTVEKAAQLREIKDAAPQVRVVVLGDDLSRGSIEAALAAGAEGCLGRDLSPRALLSYLGLVMSGEKVVPFEVAREALDRAALRTVDKTLPRGLSPREMEILSRMAQGEPNKLIARRLNLTEGTVKAHVKAILRKVEVQNRTQAALWAIRNGVVQERQMAGSVA